MSTIVKRQHYVWRNYLRAWASNEKIWTLIKDQDKIIKTDLMNVAQERYFYKLEDITDFEIRFLKKHIDNSHETLRGLQSDFLNAFIIFTDLNRRLKDNHSREVEKQLRDIEINSMEKAHGLMENNGEKLIACRSFDDIMFLKDVDLKHETVMFLCFQYLRTKKMRESVKARMLSNDQFSPDKVWKVMSFLMATNISMTVSLNPKLRFLFIDNSSEVKFLTTDQPAINIVGDILDEEGNVKGLEFYYPLSPSHALILDFKNNGNEQFQNMLFNADMVNWFNKKLLDNSDNYVFADNNEQLELIKDVS